ncbi:Z-DNA-binding protein 1 isoform X2 [Lissotriton helveticus]
MAAAADTETYVKILKFLKNGSSPKKALDIAEHLSITKSEANKHLYTMEKKKKVKKRGSSHWEVCCENASEEECQETSPLKNANTSLVPVRCTALIEKKVSTLMTPNFPLTGLELQILSYLKENGKRRTLEIAKGVGLQTRSDVNGSLYSLKEKGYLTQDNASWFIAGAKEETASDTPLGGVQNSGDTAGSPELAQMEEGQDVGETSGPSSSEVPATDAPTTSQATASVTPASLQAPTSRRSLATRVRMSQPTQQSLRWMQSVSSAGAVSQLMSGALGRAMLQMQRLQKKTQRQMNERMTQGFSMISDKLTENQTRLEAKLDALTNTVADLAKEWAEERAQLRRMERSRGHKLDALSRAIYRLTHATSQHSKRTLGLQVGIGHYSGDVARGLERITAAVETLQANVIVGGGAMGGTDSEA